MPKQTRESMSAQDTYRARPRVGPADPATQRKALADYEASAKSEARERMASKPKLAPAAPAEKVSLSATQAAKNLGGRKRKLDDAIEEAGG